MGFIEETGAAQYCRDASILTIYEGTTAIQANDLVGPQDGARRRPEPRKAIAAQIEKTEAELAEARQRRGAGRWRKRLKAAREASSHVVDFVAGQTQGLARTPCSPARCPYLMLAGNVVAGWQLARVAAGRRRPAPKARRRRAFMKAKIATARFYAEHILSKAPGTRDAIVEGADSVTALALESF